MADDSWLKGMTQYDTDRPDRTEGLVMPTSRELDYTPEESTYKPVVQQLVQQEWYGQVGKAVDKDELRNLIAKQGVHDYALRETAKFVTPSSAAAAAEYTGGNVADQLHLEPASLEIYFTINSLFGSQGVSRGTSGDDGLIRFRDVILDEFVRVITDFMGGKEER